jgi:Raf kinase inhibitor-like YbhB/YbcL family protein
MRPFGAGGKVMALTLSSPAFSDGDPIPTVFTGEGQGISPALQWTEPRAGVAEFALVCEDPDAPQDEPFVHWLVYGIPADARAIVENLAKQAAASPQGLLQGIASSGHPGYTGPMPPRGGGVHHYVFTLYALSKALELPAGATKAQLLAAMTGVIVEKAALVGTYERQSASARTLPRSQGDDVSM